MAGWQSGHAAACKAHAGSIRLQPPLSNVLYKIKILAITLARGGSKSVLKKNIREIAGKPLIAYTIEQALQSKFIDDYIVSTDCEEIAQSQISLELNSFLRPKDFLPTKLHLFQPYSCNRIY